MPYGKHTLVEAMKPPRLHSPLDGPMGVAEPPQLPNRNDTMLLIRESRQALAPRQSFCTHKVEKPCRNLDSPPERGVMDGLCGGSSGGSVPQRPSDLLDRDHAAEAAFGVDRHQGAKAAEVLVCEQ